MAKKREWEKEPVYVPHLALPGQSGWFQRRKKKGYSKKGLKRFGIKIPKYEYREAKIGWWRKK